MITSWQRRGFLIFSDDGRLVNVEASDKLLDARPAVHNGGTCSPSSEALTGAIRSPRASEAGQETLGAAKAITASKSIAHNARPYQEWTTAEAIRHKESANARLRELEFEQRAGRLLPADEVESLWRGHITDARKRLLTVPSRCASRLSHLSRAEVEVIDREIRDALQDLVGSVNKSE